MKSSFKKARLSDTALVNSNLYKSSFEGAILLNCPAYSAKFGDVDFHQAEYNHSSMTQSNLLKDARRVPGTRY